MDEQFSDEIRYQERSRLLFFGLPWTFTKYTITDAVITTNNGLLHTTEDDCYLYKIQDVRLEESLIERLFSLGTVVCYSGDTTNPTFSLKHIRHAKEIKGFLLKASEAARIRRRTLNMQDISADMADIDIED